MTPVAVWERERNRKPFPFVGTLGCVELETVATAAVRWLADHGTRWDEIIPLADLCSEWDLNHGHPYHGNCEFAPRFASAVHQAGYRLTDRFLSIVCREAERVEPAFDPIFIPLKTEFYNAFEDGSKSVEYRKSGPRWNEATILPGRPVVLSCGYGKQRRLTGFVAGFWERWVDSPEWCECYGQPGLAACISIQLDKFNEDKKQ